MLRRIEANVLEISYYLQIVSNFSTFSIHRYTYTHQLAQILLENKLDLTWIYATKALMVESNYHIGDVMSI